MPRPPTIRPATADDQAFLSEMQLAALFVPPGGDPVARAVLDDPDIRRYHGDFGRRTGDVGVVAESADGEPIGAAWVRLVRGYGFVDDETPELGIAVVEHVRGTGVGTALLESLLALVPRCSLSVDRRNAAVELYERMGFRPVRSEGRWTLVMLRDGTG